MLDHRSVSTEKSAQNILLEIAQIDRMERGKLSVMRETPTGTAYKLQSWENGKNQSRYVPPDQAEAVKGAIEGYKKFQTLTEQYAQLKIQETRAAIVVGSKKKETTAAFLLAQDQEIQQVIARFESGTLSGLAVQEFEILLRAAVFKSTSALFAFLLQKQADRIDASYQSKPKEQLKGRVPLTINSIFGSFQLERAYYYHAGKKEGHYPADAALGLENGNTPALARLICLEGADESSYEKAETHLRETGGIEFSARQIQRLVQKIGPEAQEWQQREALKPLPEAKAVPVLYVEADATGVPMRAEELEGRAGQQPDGSAKTRMSYLGCVFTQQKKNEDGSPIRDHDSTTYVSSFESIDQFGPMLRQEAIRRGLPLAMTVILLIDGAAGLANMGRLCFSTAIQIVDFYHALEHAGQVLITLLGSKEHPDYKKRLGRWARLLLRDGVERLIAQARRECKEQPQKSEAVEKELHYFVENVERMKYGTFRSNGAKAILSAPAWWKPVARR
jgi:hypothetical protein